MLRRCTVFQWCCGCIVRPESHSPSGWRQRASAPRETNVRQASEPHDNVRGGAIVRRRHGRRVLRRHCDPRPGSGPNGKALASAAAHRSGGRCRLAWKGAALISHPLRRHPSSGIFESSGVRPPVHTCRPVAGSAEGAGGEREMIVGTKATELAVAAGAAMLVAGGRGEAVLAVVRGCGGCVKSLAAIGQ